MPQALHWERRCSVIQVLQTCIGWTGSFLVEKEKCGRQKIVLNIQAAKIVASPLVTSVLRKRKQPITGYLYNVDQYRKTFPKLCEQEACADYIHMLLSIPPKCSVNSNFSPPSSHVVRWRRYGCEGNQAESHTVSEVQ